ncbi:hypothetical protein VaNZ11_000820 [Volvox africanus]|uniref:Uncharacterized protein n=1 Tax=Volvox africanus TaxID=51714 RepID=A0ABQ5RN62_9CHLO|nr:hypothetical protein VaNZ11_000820 [Volvox africanus]
MLMHTPLFLLPHQSACIQNSPPHSQSCSTQDTSPHQQFQYPSAPRDTATVSPPPAPPPPCPPPPPRRFAEPDPPPLPPPPPLAAALAASRSSSAACWAACSRHVSAVTSAATNASCAVGEFRAAFILTRSSLSPRACKDAQTHRRTDLMGQSFSGVLASSSHQRLVAF